MTMELSKHEFEEFLKKGQKLSDLALGEDDEAITDFIYDTVVAKLDGWIAPFLLEDDTFQEQCTDLITEEVMNIINFLREEVFSLRERLGE